MVEIQIKRIPWNKGKSTQIKLNCKTCLKEFYTMPSNIRRNKKYCSRKCYLSVPKNQSRNKGKHWTLTPEQKIRYTTQQLGEKNHQWKGGISDKRDKPEYKRFLRQVTKRYGKFCIVCGALENIKFHHLNAYKRYPDQAMDINNVIPICNKHHYSFHKEYGFGDNTREQFMEWLGDMTDEIVNIKQEIVNKSRIFNISLEGDDTFFANGILTHNTPPSPLDASEKEDIKEWSKRHGIKNWKGVVNHIETKGIKAGTPENPYHVTSFGRDSYRPFLRNSGYSSIPEIKEIIKKELS